MYTPIASSTLETWKENLQPTTEKLVLTTDALITLEDLKEFMTALKEKKADSVRISLVRFDWNNNEPQIKKENSANGSGYPLGCTWQKVGKKTQVAIVMNGTKNYIENSDYTIKADDIVENNVVWMLIPGGLEEGPTGHNPKPPGT